MRLWTLHPQYLDAAGLVALWREALLARAVLRGQTVGYRHHPQLDRFLASDSPRSAINRYLAAVHSESQARGYGFDRSLFRASGDVQPIPVTEGQLAYEWRWLMAKLGRRSPELRRRHVAVVTPALHPLFRRVAGPVEPWERAGERISGQSRTIRP